MARASIPTLLALDRYAKLLGINPVHFNGAAGTDAFDLHRGACSDVWPQHSWQKSDSISREELAQHIYDAEQELARVLKYFPAPVWIAQEQHSYPRHHRPDVYRMEGIDLRGSRAALHTNFSKVIQAGQRAVTLLGTPNVVYSDGDGDSYNETATITQATTLTDACEIKVYFAGHSGDPEWEIRPVRSKSIVGGNVIIVVDAWMLLQPDLWEAYPTPERFQAIRIETAGNYVTTVDVYREYTDTVSASAVFYWEPAVRVQRIGSSCRVCSGTGCVACQYTSQNGCLYVRDNERGTVVPVPATYDADDGRWEQVCFTECRDPDLVKLYYYAGEYGERWLSGMVCEPLSDYWAKIIAMMATARSERPFCSCGNVQTLSNHWRQDLSLVNEGTSHQIRFEDLSNPFGTRRGEVMAWQRVSKISGRRKLRGGIS